MEDQKKEEPITPDPEKRRLEVQGMIDSMKNIMDLVVRVKKISDAALDFLEQKGLLKEFEAFAAEKYMMENN